MGYYTEYTFDVIDAKKIDATIYGFLEEELIKMELRMGQPFDGKWYDHEKDISKLSSRFKNIIFSLTGYGEEHTDIWKKYFLNGKVQYAPATITIPKVNPQGEWKEPN